MNNERPTVKVVNIVTRSLISPPFDLTALSKEKAFEPPNFSLGRILIPQGKTKFSIFRSGSVVSRASPSILDFEEDLLSLYDYLQTYDLKLELEYSITNIVAVSKLDCPRINLFSLANQMPSSSYDSSAADSDTEGRGCNAIVYQQRDTTPKKTILLFSSSAITLTGFRSLPDLKNQSYQFKKLLKSILQKHPEVMEQK